MFLIFRPMVIRFVRSVMVATKRLGSPNLPYPRLHISTYLDSPSPPQRSQEIPSKQRPRSWPTPHAQQKLRCWDCSRSQQPKPYDHSRAVCLALGIFLNLLKSYVWFGVGRRFWVSKSLTLMAAYGRRSKLSFILTTISDSTCNIAYAGLCTCKCHTNSWLMQANKLLLLELLFVQLCSPGQS